MSDFTWNVRVRTTGQGRATAYVRRHQLEIGLPLQFDEQYDQVTALELVLAAIGADLVNGLKALSKKRRLSVDQVEATIAGELNNPLTYLGVVGEEGHPGLERVTIKVYVSSDEEEETIQQVWNEVLERSPLVRTFSPLVKLELSLRIVL